MAIDKPQYRPTANVVDTAGMPGRQFAAPMPVRAPSAPEPSMGELPIAPKPFDDSLIRSLRAFGASINTLGDVVQQERTRDTEAAANAAMTTMSTMPLSEAQAYADRVKLENKNRALVDGTMRAFGSILSTKLQAETATMQPEEASEYIRGKTAEYRERFQNEHFDKAFSPAAAQLVSVYQSKAAVDEHTRAKQNFVQAQITDVATQRERFANAPEEQQKQIVHGFLDEIIEKGAKEGMLDKKDADTFYIDLAKYAASKGDVVLVKAVLSKPRGDQPSLDQFHAESATILAKAEQVQKEQQSGQTMKTAIAYDLSADRGTFGTQPEFKGMGKDQIVDSLVERGFGREQVNKWMLSSERMDTLYAQEQNRDHFQMRQKAIVSGDPDNWPSVANNLDLRLYGGVDGVLQARAEATNVMANKWREEKAQYAAAAKQVAINKAASDLAKKSPAEFIATTDRVIQVGDEAVPVKAEALQEAAMVKLFETYDQAYPPADAMGKKISAVLERNHLTEDMKKALKIGANASSFRGVVAKTPEERAVAFSGPKQGLDTYRALAGRGGVGIVREAIGDDKALMYQAIDFLSMTKHGGDDLAAIAELAMTSGRSPEQERMEVNRLSLNERKDILKKNLVKEIGGDTVGFDTSTIKAMANEQAGMLVRQGMDADAATEVAASYFPKAFTSYKGLIVPKSGDQTFTVVQDFLMKKIEEANPGFLDETGPMALVPAINHDAFGRSGVHALRSTENGAFAEPMKPISFKMRDGSTFTLSNPRFVDLADVRKIKDAMQYDVEAQAAAQRDIDYSPKEDRLGPRFKKGGDRSWDQGFADHLNNEGVVGTKKPRSLQYAMSYFAENGEGPQRGLASIIASKIEKAGDDKFSFIPNANLRDGVDGITKKQDGKIAVGLHPDALNGETALHEGIHAVVWHFMDKFDDMKRGPDNTVSMNSEWSPAEKAGAEKVYDVYEKVKDAKFDGPKPVWFKEAQKDPDEFVSRTLTDPNFQKWLRTQKSGPDKSLWNRFVEGVKSMILSGANATEAERSLFEDAMEASNGLLTQLE